MMWEHMLQMYDIPITLSLSQGFMALPGGSGKPGGKSAAGAMDAAHAGSDFEQSVSLYGECDCCLY
jgi:hypothetical protein